MTADPRAVGAIPQAPERTPAGWVLGGVAVVVALAAVTRFLEQTVPAAAKGTALGGVAAAVEYPVYAILLGLLGNAVLTRLGLRDRLAGGFHTEFFINAGGAGRGWGRQLWERFPKFVLGFLAASVVATLYVQAVGSGAARPVIATVNDLRTLFLILAFVSIGLECRVAPLREAGWRPVGVFASATVVNLAVGLGLAVLLFSGFAAG